MEIAGTIRSFITNHKRLYDEDIQKLTRIEKIIADNQSKIGPHNIESEDVLLAASKTLIEYSYEEISASFQKLENFDGQLAALNEAIAEYNYEANQLNTGQRLGLSLLNKLNRMPSFPSVTEKEDVHVPEILAQLTDLAGSEPDPAEVAAFFKRSAKRISRRASGKRMRFEDRLLAYLTKKYGSGLSTDKTAVMDLAEHLGKQLSSLRSHYSRKPYDGLGRGRYFDLLALRARLAHPHVDIQVNTLLSQAKGYYLRGKPETQIITIPGFSWDKAPGGKPLKLTALAFKDRKLYVCVASSSKAFTIGKEANSLRFVKTTGGQKRRTSVPKTIEYVLGSFHTKVEGDTPLFLPLHFGKSYARRYLFNKQWGLFSNKTKMFLNNARLKRQKVNPGDPWTYYFDVSISAERVFGYKDFATDILTNAECVIGIDRGEVKPIAYSVIRRRDGEILEHGFLASAYISKLMEYDELKRNYQRKGQTFPKYLRSKIVRLQDTLLETAASDILALVGKYRGVVVLENLNSHFRGAELSIIPKKTYRKVETLVADALQLAGLLRIDTHGSYWGGLRTVIPGGTSQTCVRCGQVWDKNFKDQIVQRAGNLDYSNINFTRGILEFDGKRITLNHAYEVFNTVVKHTEVKSLQDLQASILAGNALLSARYLKLAMGPRLTQETFICALCGYTENADIVGAINIAKRGAEQIQKLLQK